MTLGGSSGTQVETPGLLEQLSFREAMLSVTAQQLVHGTEHFLLSHHKS